MKTKLFFLKNAMLAAGLLLLASPVSALVINNNAGTSISLTIKECVDPAVATNVKDGKSYDCVAGTHCKGTCTYAIGYSYTFDAKKMCAGEIDSDGSLLVEPGPKCTRK